MRGREGEREDPTLDIQDDRLAEFPHPVLDLTPVVALVHLLHRPEDQGAVGVELRLPAGGLDVVEDGWISPCTVRVSPGPIIMVNISQRFPENSILYSTPTNLVRPVFPCISKSGPN